MVIISGRSCRLAAMKPQNATRVVPAGEFKTKCLQLMDEVDRTGEAILITKRGRPVSLLVPVAPQAPGIRGRYKDRIHIPDEGLPRPFNAAEWADIIDSAGTTAAFTAIR